MNESNKKVLLEIENYIENLKFLNIISSSINKESVDHLIAIEKFLIEIRDHLYKQIRCILTSEKYKPHDFISYDIKFCGTMVNNNVRDYKITLDHLDIYRSVMLHARIYMDFSINKAYIKVIKKGDI